MPRLCKNLLISFFLLGLAPCWGLEALDSEEEDFVAIESPVQIPDEKQPLKKVEEPVTEKVDEVERVVERVSQTAVEPMLETMVETTAERPSLEPPFKSVESHFLDSLGIRRLSKGINIFRYSHYVLKKRASLAKSPSLPQNPIQ